MRGKSLHESEQNVALGENRHENENLSLSDDSDVIMRLETVRSLAETTRRVELGIE